MYDAFISYSRRDTRFAAKLERDLERYRPPKDTDLRKRRLRVFRDVQDISGNQLGSALKKAIRDSQYLIVICSPQSYASEWVGMEIETFLEHHEIDKLIPLLVGGRPNREIDVDDDVRDYAFHEVLCEHLDDPLAPDFRPHARETWSEKRERLLEARFQVLATLLGVSKESLIRRQRRRTWRLTALTIMGMAGLSTAFGWLAYVNAQNAAEARQQRDLAEERLRISRSRELAAASMQVLADSPYQGVSLALDADEIAYTSEAEQALRRALAENHLFAEITSSEFAVSQGSGRFAYFDVESEEIVVLDLGSMQTVWKIETMTASNLALSDDGQRLAFSNHFSGDIEVWDVNGDTRIAKWAGSAVELAFSHNGKRLLQREENTILVSDLATGQLWRLDNVGDPGIVAMDPSGREVLIDKGLYFDGFEHSGNLDGVSQLWDVDTGTRLDLRVPNSSVTAAAYSPDGNRLAVGTENGQVCVQARVDPDNWHCIPALTGWITDLSFSRDGKRIAITSTDGGAGAINLHSGESVQTLEPHSRVALVSRFSPDARYLLSAGADGTAHWTDAQSGEVVVRLGGGYGAPITDVLAHETGRSITIDFDGNAIVWDERLRGERVDLQGHSLSVSGMSFSPDGKYLATTGLDALVHIWDTRSGAIVNTITPGQLVGVTFSRRPARLFLPGPFSLGILDWQTGEYLAALKAHPDAVEASAWFYAESPDGALIAVSDGEWTTVYDADSFATVLSLPKRAHLDRTVGVSFFSDGERLLTSASANTVGVWDTSTGELLSELDAGDPVVDASAAPDGKWILIATASDLQLWDLTTNSLRRRSDASMVIDRIFEAPTGDYVAVRGSDEQDVGAVGQCRLTIWKLPQLERTAAPAGDFCLISFGPQVELAVTSGLVFRLDNGEVIADLGPSVEAILSPTGDTLATSYDTTVQLYDRAAFAPIDELRALAVQKLGNKNKKGDVRINR